jgi:hypothetical protein
MSSDNKRTFDRTLHRFTTGKSAHRPKSERLNIRLKVQASNVVPREFKPFKTFKPPDRVRGPFKKLRVGFRWLVLDIEGFAAAFAGAKSEVGSESLVRLFD